MSSIKRPEGYVIDIHTVHKDTQENTMKHIQNFDKYRSNHVILKYNELAFQEVIAFVENFYHTNSYNQKFVILDSGCGTGKSSKLLAERNPHIPVIGIDRSLVRLSKNRIFKPYESNGTAIIRERSPSLSNLFFIRAEVDDIWLMAASQSDWVVQEHYILYPNPYPKGKHLKRRWHGHPSFPALLSLGGTLDLRSNWSIYLEEMALALQAIIEAKLYPCLSIDPSELNINVLSKDIMPMTNFEKKFHAAGLPLYQLLVNLGLRNKANRIDMLQKQQQ